MDLNLWSAFAALYLPCLTQIRTLIRNASLSSGEERLSRHYSSHISSLSLQKVNVQVNGIGQENMQITGRKRTT